MITTEIVTISDKQYKRTYSNTQKMIERDGVLYSEAIDPIKLDREYTETDVAIETDNEATEADLKAQAYDILMGVTE